MLRPYQKEAFEAVRADILERGGALVVMPTASGKSHVIAASATLLSPTLILQPSRELLAQNYEKLKLIVPEEEIGIYSASFGRKEIRKFTFATIQSVYTCPELFRHFKLVIIDESHNISPKELSTMYTSFLAEIGSPKIIGFTATPYRLQTENRYDREGRLIAMTTLQMVNRMRHKDHTEMFWQRIIYHIPHKRLLDEGYLSPIEYIHEPLMPYEEIPVNKQYSDFDLDAYEDSVIGREAEILSTIAEAQRRYKSVLVFCPTTDMAKGLQTIIKGSEVVVSETKKKERDRIIKGFKDHSIKTVFNVGTLTTGFDHPALDCVILLRPTRSLPLYNQIIGRLARIAPGKDKGTVIDLTGTCKGLGRIETFEIYKNNRYQWDLKTEKCDSWHNNILFSRIG